ncbi:hypothetical protein OC834_004614 [Tilletia horrida]|nr:hypothetical protein OC834_004614 [Tilletia horrida]
MSDEGDAYLEQRLNELRSEINQTLKLFNAELQSFGKAFQDERSTFSTAHRVVDLSTGLPQPSYTKDGKTLLVLNDVQVSQISECLKAHHRSNAHVEVLSEDLAELRRQVAKLQGIAPTPQHQQQLDDLRKELAELKNSQQQQRQVQQHQNSPPRKRAHAHQASTTGRPDAKTQDAFKALLRLSFGIDEDDDWPDFPTVPKTSKKWPRHAPVDSQEGSDSPSRPAFSGPVDRLDWEKMRMDSVEVKAILNKLARIIYDNPEFRTHTTYQRSYQHIWDACFRTLEHLRCQVQEQLSMQPEKLNEKKAKKKQTDRRRGRWKSRAHARAAAYDKNKARLGAAVGALAVQACVEGDESETEAGKTAIRVVVAEWCSQENFDAQQQLEKLVSSGISGYTLLKATMLRPHDKPLDAKTSRIAVRSKFAQEKPHLVEAVKKNNPPFPPARRRRGQSQRGQILGANRSVDCS